jgi:hypothetical protein
VSGQQVSDRAGPLDRERDGRRRVVVLGAALDEESLTVEPIQQGVVNV